MRNRKLLGRVRTSTVVLLACFVGLFVLWLQVRPLNQRSDERSTSDITDAPPRPPRHRPAPLRTPHATAVPKTVAPEPGPVASAFPTPPGVVPPTAGTSTPAEVQAPGAPPVAASHSPTPRATPPVAFLP